MINSTSARYAFLALIIAGFVLSFLAIYWMGRDGGISWPVAQQAIKRLLEIYTPILGILAGFYFASQDNHGSEPVSLDAFIFAFSVLSIWCLVIPSFIALSETIEAALRLIDSVSVLGSSLAASAVSFYFAKGQRKRMVTPRRKKSDKTGTENNPEPAENT